MASTARTTPASKAKLAPASFSIEKAEKEVEDGRRPDPFVVELKGGERVTFRDPMLLGWLDVASLDTSQPLRAIQTLLSDEDYKTFVASEVNAGAIQALMNSLVDWYGILDSGN